MSNEKNLDCLFLVSNSSSKTYQSLSKTYSAIEPPTWALLLAQSTRSIGFKVKILDANAENLTEKEILNKVKIFLPKMICLIVYGQNVNAGTTNMSGAIYISEYLKKNINIPILVMHGEKDTIVPFSMGEKIYQLANEPKSSYFTEHDDHMMEYDEPMIKTLKNFIELN